MSFTRPSLRAFLALLISAASAHASEEIQCPTGDVFKPPFDTNAAATYCKGVGPEKCASTIKKIVDGATELNARLATTCGRVGQLDHDIASTAGLSPKEAFSLQSRIYGGLLGDYNDYNSALAKQYQEVGGTLNPDSGPLGKSLAKDDLAAAAAAGDKFAPERQLIRAAITDKTFRAMKTLSLGPAASPADTNNDATVFAARNGAGFMQKVLKQSEEVRSTITQLNSLKAKAEDNLRSLDRPESPEKKGPGAAAAPAGGSGLDLKSLAGLATAGAGLAQMLNKKDAAANAGEAGATAATPPSANGSKAGPSAPNVSKLGGDGGKAASNPPISATPPKKDTPSSPRVPSSEGYSPYSDISKSQGSPFAMNTSTPAAAKAAGGGAGGGKTGGGDTEAAAAAKAAGGPNGPAPDESTQGIGGGLLGGGGPPPLAGGAPPPGAPGADAAANPEASMNDLLHEMKETAEGGGASPDAQAGANDIAMADDDLFPRVRACYTRIMKAGRVLDGLSEKITPENP